MTREVKKKPSRFVTEKNEMLSGYQELACKYFGNKSAWMTSYIFNGFQKIFISFKGKTKGWVLNSWELSLVQKILRVEKF